MFDAAGLEERLDVVAHLLGVLPKFTGDFTDTRLALVEYLQSIDPNRVTKDEDDQLVCAFDPLGGPLGGDGETLGHPFLRFTPNRMKHSGVL